MLNNWLSTPKIRNYFSSGFFFDFFIKKIILKFLTNSMQFSIMFLEKFLIEKLFKNSWSLFLFTNYLQNKLTHKILGFVFVLLNIILLTLISPALF